MNSSPNYRSNLRGDYRGVKGKRTIITIEQEEKEKNKKEKKKE
jgi:hypothetical protein